MLSLSKYAHTLVNQTYLSLGELIEDVNKTINQIPENNDNKNDEVKKLLNTNYIF